ncbi:coiled-coil-helix-coiled-coil-helix domain-containing protein 5 isoform X5 [Zootoca vivipara]|uniref:coiled-coil-helix-coiled-coil-helix domain-containing protein 5 isoform X5 n=1 Tax=Zootoca vivipara TaxID=8524 RepID=UPI00293BC470|nr:coiled-coil-helix-coiled-coil-helix domain-containing protein 5 isoform X5 [Zootoca vivipara]
MVRGLGLGDPQGSNTNAFCVFILHLYAVTFFMPRDLRTRPLTRQAALEVTARHCRKEAEQYGQCVAANPSSWQQDCHQLKLEMAKCTSSHTKKGDLLCVNSAVSTGLKVPGSRNGNNVILKIY